MTVLSELAAAADLNAAVARATAVFKLRALGWAGLEHAQEVVDLKSRCPELHHAANVVSEYVQNYEVVWSVIRKASSADRQEIRGYLVGRLALELLSCHLSGASAGSCDKLAAFRCLLAA